MKIKNQNDLLAFLLSILIKEENNFKDIKLIDNYSFTCVKKDEFEDILFEVSITKVSEDTKAIEFIKLEGNLMAYYEMVKSIKKNYLIPVTKHYENITDDSKIIKEKKIKSIQEK